MANSKCSLVRRHQPRSFSLATMQGVLLSYAAPRKEWRQRPAASWITVPDSVAKLVVESTDVKVRILRSKVGVVVPPSALGLARTPRCPSRPTDARKPTS